MGLYLNFGLQTSRLADMDLVWPTRRPTNSRFADLTSRKDKGRFLIEGTFYFTCQNSIPAAVGELLQAVFKTNPRITVRADDASLPFDISKMRYDYTTNKKIKEGSIATPKRLQDVMGGYAEQVSPIISPYFVRHIVDDYRTVEGISVMGGVTRRVLVERLEIIRQAAEEGIPLNTNLRETWGVEKTKGYGMFRTEPLWQSTPDKMRDETGYFKGKGYQPPSWEELCQVFPPRSIRKAMVT